MSLWTALLFGFSLSMDTFAIALALALTLPRLTPSPVARVAFSFGFAQFVMPVIGWAAGTAVAGVIARYDHWAAFGLLFLIGAHMAWEARDRRMRTADCGMRNERRGNPQLPDRTRGVPLLILAVATSIDALAVGVTFSFQRVPIWWPSAVIGIVAATMSFLGMLLGRRLGIRFGRFAHLLGGLILIALGTRILIQHLS